ncbi:glycerophosphodiester phosphodiesterase family protein [Corynebacterium choanae]|uniref:Cytoplasmic glycerophosphodiester phosphodiesterase n=1 Tax=Corynebacterium choanae TaxID=1862358 RepID=A0A3G6JEZ3_9CORY|nr:glycerophosphodiester phosphodiesterase family protein [Corynebacterium choanae]AZA14704.1 cytoplasmic glycerophosphodiester phosphodiesterase [Corynebacterium choanae]
MNLFAQARKQAGRALIAAHRGTAGGCIFPNTLAAAKVALAHGADIVELDVVRSKDGVYFSFHDGYEEKELATATPISAMTASEVATHPYGQVFHHPGVATVDEFFPLINTLPDTLINVDRSWRYWEDGLLQQLAECTNPQRLVVKSPAEDRWLTALAQASVALPYMPIVHTEDDLARVFAAQAKYPTINLIGVELIAADVYSPLANPARIAELREQGLLIWLNALNLENLKDLFCGFDDHTSILDDPARGWGKLVEYGADIIQTDWPRLLADYLAAQPSTSSP